MAIDPAFLADLRRHHRCELILLMVQLEQLTPNWWPSLIDLSNQVGSERSTLNKALLRLDERELIARASISNNAGTFIWWVKRHPKDEPDPRLEPRWTLRDHLRNRTEYLPLTGQRRWAERNGVNYPTLRGFLAGRQFKLLNRWSLQATPLDSWPSTTSKSWSSANRPR
ncbi:MAG: hypothetical protein RLZZ515_1052 [Cyanobacteriota bacterium]|jgi:hypothetical protein